MAAVVVYGKLANRVFTNLRPNGGELTLGHFFGVSMFTDAVPRLDMQGVTNAMQTIIPRQQGTMVLAFGILDNPRRERISKIVLPLHTHYS